MHWLARFIKYWNFDDEKGYIFCFTRVYVFTCCSFVLSIKSVRNLHLEGQIDLYPLFILIVLSSLIFIYIINFLYQ